MRLNVMIEAQEGVRYDELLAVARHAEAVGLDGFFRSDHYDATISEPGRGATDAWATLAGIARETERITVGTLVSPATFRTVGSLAKSVATVAEMAGSVTGASRVELGLGTGWLEREHTQHGFPFEDLATRFRRLEEHLQVVRGLWDREQQPFSFDGEFVSLRDAVVAPAPDPRPRIIVGGRGPRRTPALAARYADELNAIFPTVAEARERRATLDSVCTEAGRDPGDVALSVMVMGLVGSTQADVERRADRLRAHLGSKRTTGELLERLAEVGVAGTPEQAAERLGAFAEAGVDRVMLQHLDPGDLDMLDVVAGEVAPLLD